MNPPNLHIREVSMNTDMAPALAERSEAEAMYSFEQGASADVQTSLGMARSRIGGGVVLSMRHDPSRYWNKALGFGFDEPVTAELIREVFDFYRSQKTPMTVLQLAPSVLPEDWDEICGAENLSAGSSTVKLVCETDAALARIEEHGRPGTVLRVDPVEASQADEWGSVMMRAFEMPGEGLARMTAGSAGAPGWHPYAAWDGDELVAVGTMHVHEDAAQFFGGATLPGARRRGGQSAILAARVRAAKAAGCRWLVAETGPEAPGTHNSSLHNMQRIGFSVIYERRNWIWTGSPSGAVV
jgi:GNAT superfamily N-acetyltransferase